MRNRLTKTLLATAAVAVVALPAGAQARQGGDDPAGHVRHAVHRTAVSHHTRDRHQHRHRHGADDDTTLRHGGADDGPNHR
jgi:Ni/Co efflux regulator RcnB